MRRVQKLIALMLCYILSISALIHPMAIYASTLQVENASNEQQDEQEQEQGQEEGDAPESTEGSGSVDNSSSGQSDDQQENAVIPDGESVDSEPQSVDSSQSDQPEQDAEAASDDVADKEQDKANSWRYKDGERIDVQSEDNGISAYSMDALPSGATAQGIDVSVWQGDIDWQKVKDAGIDFAIIRLGYWTNGTDKKLERNVSECERLGIPWGAYLYSYCSDPSQAAAEADHAIDLLNQLKAKGHTPDLPVYFDMEDDDLLSGSRDFAGMATQFCSKVEAAGYTAGVYANKNWWTNYLTSSVFNNWSRWVAQYNSVCTYGGSYDAWQYTSSGSVPGISGGVDMNWWYGVPDCSSVTLSVQADGSALSLSTSGFTTAPKNVAFAVTSSTGTTKWYQAYQQPDGSWTASPSVAKDFGAYGTYSVSAWATFGISTISVATASAVLSAGDVEASASVSGESLELAVSGWSLEPTNVSFEVIAPSGPPSRWYQAYRQSDGSWTADAPAFSDMGEVGAYSVRVWATIDGFTSLAATASAEFSAGDVSVSASIEDGSIALSASGWALPARNASFEVRSPSGASRWYQAYRQSDGSWTAGARALRDFGEWGEYSVIAWANYGATGGASAVATASAVLSAGDVEASASVSGESLELAVSGWSLEPTNVSFEVIAPSGPPSRWYQAYRQSDGSWTADAPAFSDMGEVGAYSVRVWATIDGFTSLAATASAEFSAGDVSVSASIEDGSIALSASGWALPARNASFEVRSPSGASRWYQAYRQSDGSWKLNANIGADFGEWGEYTATAWATYAGVTKSYGVKTAMLDRVSISYSVRKSGGGWVDGSDGNQASTWNGTIACGANALRVKMLEAPIDGSVQVQGYASGNGWTAQGIDGADAGPFSESAIFSGIKVSFTGDIQNYADIWYRVYVNDFGWLGWTSNGSLAGTTNLNLQVQSVEMIALPKGSSAPGSTINASLTEYPYIGFQNPAGYYQVSNKSVSIPHLGEGIFGYRSESTISYKATREECINAMITRSMDYLGTPYRWDYSCAPGVGVDCAGLVMQALYATGMDLSPMNPWDHYYLGLSGGWHSAYANYMWNNGRFQKLSFSQRQRGDIISWSGHVAIYLGNDQIIEAAYGDVHIASVYRYGTPRGVLRPFIG